MSTLQAGLNQLLSQQPEMAAGLRKLHEKVETEQKAERLQRVLLAGRRSYQYVNGHDGTRRYADSAIISAAEVEARDFLASKVNLDGFSVFILGLTDSSTTRWEIRFATDARLRLTHFLFNLRKAEIKKRNIRLIDEDAKRLAEPVSVIPGAVCWSGDWTKDMITGVKSILKFQEIFAIVTKAMSHPFGIRHPKST